MARNFQTLPKPHNVLATPDSSKLGLVGLCSLVPRPSSLWDEARVCVHKLYSLAGHTLSQERVWYFYTFGGKHPTKVVGSGTNRCIVIQCNGLLLQCNGLFQTFVGCFPPNVYVVCVLRDRYGRVFLSKTLRNVPAFAQAFARAKEKGGGVIPESGCGVGVTSIFLPGQNGNGLLSCLRFCPGIACGPEWGFARASGWGFVRASG